jgi:hypothetical protein
MSVWRIVETAGRPLPPPRARPVTQGAVENDCALVISDPPPPPATARRRPDFQPFGHRLFVGAVVPGRLERQFLQ